MSDSAGPAIELLKADAVFRRNRQFPMAQRTFGSARNRPYPRPHMLSVRGRVPAGRAIPRRARVFALLMRGHIIGSLMRNLGGSMPAPFEIVAPLLQVRGNLPSFR
jgi:hypothetical protein